jgi:hypothetical protein
LSPGILLGSLAEFSNTFGEYHFVGKPNEAHWDILIPRHVREEPMPHPFRAQVYRDIAHLLREEAAASALETQKNVEATARHYDLLAKSVEDSIKSEVRQSRRWGCF